MREKYFLDRAVGADDSTGDRLSGGGVAQWAKLWVRATGQESPTACDYMI